MKLCMATKKTKTNLQDILNSKVQQAYAPKFFNIQNYYNQIYLQNFSNINIPRNTSFLFSLNSLPNKNLCEIFISFSINLINLNRFYRIFIDSQLLFEWKGTSNGNMFSGFLYFSKFLNANENSYFDVNYQSNSNRILQLRFIQIKRMVANE